MHHHREGRGEPLVLIHGVGHHWQAWQPVIDRLTGHYDVLACDSPGFGRSAPLPHNIRPTVWAYADAFEEFFHDHELDRPHVAGNSMGGAIALELSRRRAVRSATVLAPAGFWTPAERKYAQVSLGALARTPNKLQPSLQRIARTQAGRAALLAQFVKRPAAVPFDEVESMFADAFAAPAFLGALAAFDDYDFTEGDKLDSSTVTVAWGDADRLLLHGRQSARAVAALPKARHVTIDAGHVPFFDCPEVVAQLIRTTAVEKNR